MEPLLDSLFAAFKNSDLLHKALGPGPRLWRIVKGIELKEKLLIRRFSLVKASELPANHVEDRTRKTGGRKLAKRLTWNGLEISIETAKGQTRTWYDPENAEHGTTTMLYDYGYVRGTIGADGDHVDVFVGPDPNAAQVYVVDQMKRPEFKALDEQKVMLGFPSLAEARAAYLKHYNDPRFLGSIRAMPRDEFCRKVTETSEKKPLIRSFRIVKGGPYIGPKGGKWADAAHTIPWKEKQGVKSGDRFEVKTHPALGMVDRFTFKVEKVEGGQALVSINGTEVTMDAASVRDAANDLMGRVEGPESGDPTIDAVIGGRAEFLGKGDDGLAFHVGDQVVKVSTTVPYQPQNRGHRTREQAVAQAREQHRANKEMRAAGVPNLLPERFVTHAGRAYTIKPYLEIPDKLSEARVKEVHDAIDVMHKKGWVLGDQVQVGTRGGEVYLLDTGKAHRSDSEHDRDRDNERIESFYREHGVEGFVPRGVGANRTWQALLRIASGPLMSRPENRAKHEAKLRAVAKQMLEQAQDDLDREIVQEDLDQALKKLAAHA